MRGCLTLLFFVVLVLLVVAYFTADDDASESRPEHSEYAAWLVCQDLVKQQLKAPSTARFPAFNANAVISRDDVPNANPPMREGLYIIRSYVDAQNSFGTMIRTDFLCSVQYENGKWRVIQLSM